MNLKIFLHGLFGMVSVVLKGVRQISWQAGSSTQWIHLNKENLQLVRPDVKRVGLSEPTSESKTCPHGGCVYDTVGQPFSRLDALDEVIAADVLDV